MAYQPINKPIPFIFNGRKVWGKRDCEDFKPIFWDRRYCKLSDKCDMHGYHTKNIFINSRPDRVICTGIAIARWQEIIS